jgi:hypothetical protein
MSLRPTWAMYQDPVKKKKKNKEPKTNKKTNWPIAVL